MVNPKHDDVAAFVWPSYHPDDRAKIFWPMGIGEWEASPSVGRIDIGFLHQGLDVGRYEACNKPFNGCYKKTFMAEMWYRLQQSTFFKPPECDFADLKGCANLITGVRQALDLEGREVAACILLLRRIDHV